MPPIPGGRLKFFLTGGSTPRPTIPTQTIAMGSFLIEEISLHPSNYIWGRPRHQVVEPLVRVSGKLAPGTCGIKIKLD